MGAHSGYEKRVNGGTDKEERGIKRMSARCTSRCSPNCLNVWYWSVPDPDYHWVSGPRVTWTYGVCHECAAEKWNRKVRQGWRMRTLH